MPLTLHLIAIAIILAGHGWIIMGKPRSNRQTLCSRIHFSL